MSVHDWSGVTAGIFHHFHNCWLAALSDALNHGLLPPDFYTLIEQHASRSIADVLTLHVGATPLPALERPLTIRHVSGHRIVTLLEVVSPVNTDRPQSIPRLARKIVTAPVAYLEHLRVGSVLPEVRLFLTPERSVNVPVEATCQVAWKGEPAFYQRALEDGALAEA